uniref:nucleotidyltransferase domain-containing protein n=1 Tax=Agathobacter sp. TaxID=2021311 RepID=UPI004056961E
MKKELFDLIYLAGCGVCQVIPDKACLEILDIPVLYNLSKKHFLTALLGTTLKEAGVILPKEWEQAISKAVRKNILFDIEREKLLSFMEQEGIWHLSLKGIILKDFYPSVGMRQMSDNDILFDERFGDKVQKYMQSQGYETVSIAKGNHDIYKKEPIYNFELHRALYGSANKKEWENYYKNIKDKLILNSGSFYEYYFRDEDFYIYMVSHAYKHYIGSGTGLRTLLDFYVYLKAKEQDLDFSYIEKECKILGIADFERKNRILCKKAFSITNRYDKNTWEKQFSQEETEMLFYYLSSGVYGTMERMVENRIRKLEENTKSKSKFRYLWNRLFPDETICKHYLPFCKYKCLFPIAWAYRIMCLLADKKRRKQIIRELKIVKKI